MDASSGAGDRPVLGMLTLTLLVSLAGAAGAQTPPPDAESVRVIAHYLADKPYDSNLPKRSALISPQQINGGFNAAFEKLFGPNKLLRRFNRNEIYARHGYAFVKTPWKEIYAQVPWYHADRKFNESALTASKKEAVAEYLEDAPYEVCHGSQRCLADAFEKSCDIGDATNCAELGQMYFDYTHSNAGFPQDAKKALALFRQSCDWNSNLGCAEVAEVYERGGFGVPPNPELALAAERKVCGFGDTKYCLRIALHYLDRNDASKAAPFLKDACKNNFADGFIGCGRLGELYEAGDGVARDTATAQGMYRRACAGGQSEYCDRIRSSEQFKPEALVETPYAVPFPEGVPHLPSFVVDDAENLYVFYEIDHLVRRYDARGRLLEKFPVPRENGDRATAGYGQIYRIAADTSELVRGFYVIKNLDHVFELRGGRFTRVPADREKRTLASLQNPLSPDRRLSADPKYSSTENAYDGIRFERYYIDARRNLWLLGWAGGIGKYDEHGEFLFHFLTRDSSVSVSRLGHFFTIEMNPKSDPQAGLSTTGAPWIRISRYVQVQ